MKETRKPIFVVYPLYDILCDRHSHPIIIINPTNYPLFNGRGNQDRRAEAYGMRLKILWPSALSQRLCSDPTCHCQPLPRSGFCTCTPEITPSLHSFRACFILIGVSGHISLQGQEQINTQAGGMHFLEE